MRCALLLLLLAFVLPLLPAVADDKPVWNSKTKKKATELATRWWKARPKTQFVDWDPAVRKKLLDEAKAFGAIPEGKLADVVAALWKPIKKHGPRHKPGGKATIQTPYGEAWFLVNCGGKGKGLVIGLHGELAQKDLVHLICRPYVCPPAAGDARASRRHLGSISKPAGWVSPAASRRLPA